MKPLLQLSSDNGGTLGATALVAHNLANSGASQGGPTVLLKDTFTAPDGTNLASHVMDVGAGWTLSGTWTIQGGKAVPAATTANLAWADCGQANCTLTVDVVPQTASFPAILVRLTDANNFWLAQVDSATAALDLFSCVAGTFTKVASTAFAITPGATYTMTAVVSGSTLTLTVNATSVTYSGMTTNLTATKCGLRNGWGSGSVSTYDNFKATT
jgi:hypothetical protein